MAGAFSALMSSMVMSCCFANMGNPCRDARSVKKGCGLLRCDQICQGYQKQPASPAEEGGCSAAPDQTAALELMGGHFASSVAMFQRDTRR